MLQGGNGRFVLQALPKIMNIKLDGQSEKCIREMIRRNRLYRSPVELVGKAVNLFLRMKRGVGLSKLLFRRVDLP